VATLPTLRVRRWHNQVLVPADHPRPESARDHVDDAVRRMLAPALASLLGGPRASPLAAHGATDELVFVRQLELDWSVDAAWSADEIVSLCARTLAREVLAEIAAPEPGNVVRFGSYLDFLASYIVARAADVQPRPWFHAHFDGWALLPASSAIRAALCADAGQGRAALRALPRSSLLSVVSALHARDADYILQGLAEPAPSSTDALRAVLLAATAAPPPASVIEGDALGVWLLARTSPAVDRGALETGAIVLRALETAARGSEPVWRDMLDRVCAADGPLPAFQAAARAGASAVLQRLAEAAGKRGTSAPSESPRYFTRLGGAFLLLDDVERLPMGALCADWPAPEGASPVVLLRLVILGHCLGGPAWGAVFREPFWRDRLPTASAIDGPRLAAWLETLGSARAEALEAALTDARGVDEAAITATIDASGAVPAPWNRVLAIAACLTLSRFACRLPGFAASGAAYLRDNFLAATATVDFEPDRIVVRLSRTPLQLILQLTGLTRGERSWPWLDPRPFALFTGD
jgi:hypothetical protein